jgi:hypothetical protein
VTACEWCGAGLPPRKPGPGRPRRFCSKACKSAAYREAEKYGAPGSIASVDADAVRALTVEAVDAVLAGAAPSDPIGQLAQAVSETEALAVEYGRLARSTPANLAERSAAMSDHLRAGLTRLFPREDT